MNRLCATIPLAFLVQLALFSASPKISEINVIADTNAAVVKYNVSPDSYCWVRYGVSRGTYLWSSVTFSSASSPGVCSVPVTGLNPNATFNAQPTGALNAGLIPAPGLVQPR